MQYCHQSVELKTVYIFAESHNTRYNPSCNFDCVTFPLTHLFDDTMLLWTKIEKGKNLRMPKMCFDLLDNSLLWCNWGWSLWQ